MLGDSSELQILVSMKNKASAEIAKLKSELAGIGSEGTVIGNLFSGLGNKFGLEMNLIKKAATTAALGVAALSTAAIALGWQAAKTAGNLESWRQGFVNLLKSAEKADKTIEMIKKDAAKTPFELPGLVQANLLLTQITKDGERSEKMLLNVGKALAAAGKGQAELDRVIVNLQQIGNTAKISEMDVRQFGFAGINILELLADYYGTTKEKAGDMVKDSKDAFADLEGAFAKAGEAGGQFANSFELQAGTFNQLMSNLSDSLNILGADVMVQSGLFNILKDAIAGATAWINNNKQAIADFIKDGVEKAKVKVQEWVASMGGKEGLTIKLQAMWTTLTTQVVPAVKDLADKLIAVVGFIIEHREGLVKLLVVYEAWKVATTLMTLATTGLTTAVNLLKGAVAFLTTAFGLIASVVVIATAVAWKLNDAMSNGGSTMDFWRKVVMSLFGPIGMAIEYFKHWDDYVNKLKESFSKFSSIVSNVIGKLKDFISKKDEAGDISEKMHGGYVRGRQFGGHPSTDELTLVGEAGPELVKLPVGSKVIPNNKIGGGSVSFNFNFAGAVITDKQSLMNEIISSINRKSELRELGSTV